MEKPFPLTSSLAPEVSFGQGRWTILIHHHDCPHCQEAVPQYERLAAHDQERRVALLLRRSVVGQSAKQVLGLAIILLGLVSTSRPTEADEIWRLLSCSEERCGDTSRGVGSHVYEDVLFVTSAIVPFLDF